MIIPYIEQYEKLEREHWWWRARRKILSEKIKKYMPLGMRKSLLDIGCGSGITLLSLQDEYDCAGIEPEEQLIRRAEVNTRAPVYRGEIPASMPEINRQFDVTLLLDVIEHIEADAEALTAVKKYMRPDGILILNVPAMPSLWSVHDEVNEHKRRYEYDQLKAVIQKAGFSILEINYWGTILVPLAKIRKIWHRNTSQKNYKVALPGSWLNALLEKMVLFEQNWNLAARNSGLSLMAVVKRSEQP